MCHYRAPYECVVIGVINFYAIIGMILDPSIIPDIISIGANIGIMLPAVIGSILGFVPLSV